MGNMDGLLVLQPTQLVQPDEKAETKSFSTPKKNSKRAGNEKQQRKEQKVPYSHRWLLTTLKGHSGTVLNLDFSTNGRYLASCADGVTIHSDRNLLIFSLGGGALCWNGGNPCQSRRQQPKQRDDSPNQRNTTKKMRQNNTNGLTQPLKPITSMWPKHNGIRPPLPVYAALAIDGQELYHHMTTYILTMEERKRYGFPLECPNQPGKVEVSSIPPVTAKPENPNERTCCRCQSKFHITEDGDYEADDTCTYHWGKRKSVDTIGDHASIVNTTVFGCCDQDMAAPGCTRSRFHVSTRPEIGSQKFVKTRYKRPNNKTSGFGIYALDCEMCFTRQGLEVTKVTVVGPDGLTIYDSFVLPENPIVDYNTNFSGITAHDMKNVRTTLADVHAVLLKLFNAKTILIGHGLENDLKALRVLHETIIDTSVIFPHYYGLPFRRSLKSLINCYLQKTIQEDGFSHDSAEDARACMELMLWKVLKDKQLGFKQRKPHTTNGS